MIARAASVLNLDLMAALETAARRDPGRVALVDREQYLTFERLLDAIDRRTQLLAQRCQTGARIGVRLDCSVETVVTYFACLRAGMLYAPLASLPPIVMANVLRVLSLDAVLTDTASVDTVQAIRLSDRPVDREVELPDVSPSQPSHILLTSGSTTGMPKAVITDQLGSMYSHAWRSTTFAYRDDDVVGCNIFGIWDAVPALHHGIPVLMISDAVMRDPRALAVALVRHDVSRTMMTPTLFAACLSVPDAVRALRRLRLIVLCGEIVHPQLVARARAALPDTAIGNLYSIAECHDVAAAVFDPDGGALRLRPADFADIYVTEVDRRDRLVANGLPGRILVGGAGLGVGYLCEGVPENRFFELALDGRVPVRVYDTGDLGIMHASGDLQVLGRCDPGVKIRGQWVDPQEVSAALVSHPDVIDAAVEERHGKLTARVVRQANSTAASSSSEVRAFLKARLPSHCVPNLIEFVAALGLGASGKAGSSSINRAGVESADIERRVLTVFREVLGDSTIGPDDDFVERGGDSLAAITLVGALQRQTGRCISMADFYTYSRPALLARFLRGHSQPQPTWRLPTLEPDAITRRSAPPVHTILLTGANGHLGNAVRRQFDVLGKVKIIALTRGVEVDGVTNVIGDLAQPRLGLGEAEFHQLGEQIDAIVHLAAVVDPFAPYAALEPVNVKGTRELIRLAGRRCLPLHYVSSSSVFPLGGGQTWSEELSGTEHIERLAGPLAASGADAYSRSKLAAESLLWQAGDQGLPVRVIRIPHVLGHPKRDRLQSTVDALIAAGVFPEGDWCWQFVSAEAVGRAVAAGIRSLEPVRHLAPAPLAAACILDSLWDTGIDLQPVSPAAMATALRRVADSHAAYRNASALIRLIADHGPRAALNLDDAMLVSASSIEQSTLALFRQALTRRSLKA